LLYRNEFQKSWKQTIQSSYWKTLISYDSGSKVDNSKFLLDKTKIDASFYMIQSNNQQIKHLQSILDGTLQQEVFCFRLEMERIEQGRFRSLSLPQTLSSPHALTTHPTTAAPLPIAPRSSSTPAASIVKTKYYSLLSILSSTRKYARAVQWVVLISHIHTFCW
jgi:hypothetical protein